MKTAIAALLLATSALAQNAFYLDLSGPWLHMEGDDPRYARTDLDDSSWSVRSVPMPDKARNFDEDQRFWLRRHLVLPAESAARPLSVTVGGISEAFEVYVNGQRVGASGPFDPHTFQLARARTFDLPAGLASGQTVIAVRVWWPVLQGVSAFLKSDDGPWTLSSAEIAPRHAGENALEHQQLDSPLILLLGITLAFISGLVLVLWWSERQRKELVWLGLFLAQGACGRLAVYLSLAPDAHPWGWKAGALLRPLLHVISPMALLAAFVAAFVRVRWLPWIVWPVAALGLLLPVAGVSLNHDEPLWLLYLLIFAGLASPAPHLSRTVRGWFSAGVVVLVYMHMSGFGNLGQVGVPVLSGFLNFRRLAPYASGLVYFSVAYLVYLLRTMVRDGAEKQRLASEMQAARSVQQFLVPAAPPSSADYSIDAVYEPAREVGGDLHWSRVEPDGAVCIVVGDVSGKGLGAAMLVSVVVGALDAEESGQPATILRKLNTVVHKHSRGGFVTARCVRVEPDGRISAASAGHPAPYGTAGEITVEVGLPLGIVPETGYTALSFTLARGEAITIVTDGVIEAENAKRELFGFDRTRDIRGQSAQEIAEAAKAWGQNDDITVVTIRRNA